MSALPAYKKDDESAESQPLWTGEEDINENDDPAPSYPPREASASASGSGSDNPRGSIRYIFQPRWPIPGSEEYALGVLGVDKIETAQNVQRGFRVLRDFPLDRIEFLAPIDETKTQASDQWGLVMDEAWSRFDRDPPKVLRVRVADEPGDKEARDRHETKQCLGWTAVVILFFATIFGAIIFFASRS